MLPSDPAAIVLTLERPQPEHEEPEDWGSGSAYSTTPPAESADTAARGESDDGGRTNGPLAVQPAISSKHTTSVALIDRST
jgi:hypothetical protein